MCISSSSRQASKAQPQFAPPEQLRGEPLDVRADIYAVGATLYYLLTGRTPFDAPDLKQLFEKVTSEAPVLAAPAET
jgi:serine/threonine protein kinase